MCILITNNVYSNFGGGYSQIVYFDQRINMTKSYRNYGVEIGGIDFLSNGLFVQLYIERLSENDTKIILQIYGRESPSSNILKSMQLNKNIDVFLYTNNSSHIP